MTKLFLLISLLYVLTHTVESRPFTDQFKNLPEIFLRFARKRIDPIRAEDSGPPPPPQRGSAEETRRILQEINKINQAFGYTRKSDIALPRQGSNPSTNNFFYPRPVYQPSIIQNAKRPPYYEDQTRYSREINPFKANTFFYPAPYLHLPSTNKAVLFVPKDRINKFNPVDVTRFNEFNYFNQPVVVLPSANKNGVRFSKHMKSQPLLRQNEEESNESDDSGDIIDTLVKVVVGNPPSKEELDTYDGYDSVEASNELEEVEDSEEIEEETNKPSASSQPVVTNDKFLHTEFLQKHNIKERQQEMRGFNFTTPNFIKNLTERFSKPNHSESPNTIVADSTSKEENKNDSDYDDSETSYMEGIRAPWGGKFPGGPKGQRETLAGGGLIIQRLRVRNGSIAVAGPGGVATAGSGGTAIVGPEGLAITHPRSLTIAGPGARVYEVPETTNLEEELLSINANGEPADGVLVAVGPTVHYNST